MPALTELGTVIVAGVVAFFSGLLVVGTDRGAAVLGTIRSSLGKADPDQSDSR